MLKKIGFILPIVLLVGFFAGKHFYMQPKFINGEVAPAFTGQTLKGETVALSDFKGKYVLLDFWGTWCMPCRKEIPDLKKMYDSFHDKKFKDASNFEIISIALEKEGTEARLQKAVQSLQLNWDYHIFDGVTNFKFLDAKISSEAYGVKEVPTKYLINPDGYIMGVNLPFDQMEEMLTKRLK